MHPNESRIIPLLQKKDKKGIELLYEHYAENLFGVIKTIIRDDALAQDILQESFIKFWQKGDTYNPEKSRLFTWLLTITRNTAIDKIRSVQNRTGKEIQIANYDVNRSGNTTFNIDGIDLLSQIKKLDDKYQQVLHHLFFKGMTQQETSKVLGIPLGTVKTRLRFGLKELRKVFSDKTITAILLLTTVL